MYQLFCDSNCELWYTTVKELGLNVIRMPYTIDGKEYFYDMGEHTDFKGFLDKMRAGAVPKTSALNEYAYTEYFEPVLARGEDIYYVTFSHKMSATFNAMDSAIAALKEKYPEKSIWVWSGFLYENVVNKDIFKYIDVLVDGTFKEELHDPRLKWCGSKNQRVIDIKKSLSENKIILYEDNNLE